MAHLVLQDVDPRAIEALGERAERHGRSPQEEARAVLEDALGFSRAGALEAARRLRRSWQGRPMVAGQSLLRGAGDGDAGGAAGEGRAGEGPRRADPAREPG